MTWPAIVALTPGGVALARRIADATGGGEVHGLAGRGEGADRTFSDTIRHLGALYAAGRPIIGVCAAGILVRALGPLAGDKTSEPAVVAVAEDGSVVVPLLGGHHGGNALARRIAAELGAVAAITTASDRVLGVALDDPPPGYRLANIGHCKDFTRRLLAGEAVRISGAAPWLEGFVPAAAEARLEIVVSECGQRGSPARLIYHPTTLAVGIGAERGADPGASVALATAVLGKAGLAPRSVAVVASLDLKEDEPAIYSVSETFSCPTRFFSADQLALETPRLANPSPAVYRAVGCYGVAEAAALAAAGPDGELIVEKQAARGVTCAIARAPAPIDAASIGRARAELAIVGLGPGGADWRSREADALIARASDLVGYKLYLDLAGAPAPGQRRHAFRLGEEEARVRHALELAGEGRRVALVSSGDAGIYGMAALAFEVIESGPAAWRRIHVTIAPGISALQAASARAGAPIGHDFCAISLSDLMTPTAVIERRLRAAAEADFVVALYNPASARRRALLSRALGILAAHRPPATPVVIARDLGRPGEHVQILRLDEVDPGAVDMLTVVLVGASTTRSFTGGDGSRLVYTPRGYGLTVSDGGKGAVRS